MLGSLPPLRGISGYCFELACGVSQRVPVEFISFRRMYPRRFYPGGDLADDNTFPAMIPRGLVVRRSLTWYNPLSWIRIGLGAQADVVHVQHWSLPLTPIFAIVAGLLKLRGARVVVTVHNVEPHEPSRLFPLATRLICRLADRCVVHTESNRQHLRAALNLPANRVRVIRLGLMQHLRQGKPDRAGARLRLGLPPTAPVALFFGAIRPYKGLDVLLEAFARVLHAQPDAILLIAGKLWMDWATVEAQIARLGIAANVKAFPRYVPTGEVHEFFDAADVQVLPYRHFDAQTGAGLAGLAFGKPLVVTDVGGLADLAPDRRFVAPPGDAAALAECLGAILSDAPLRARMTARAEAMAKQYSWDDIADETVRLYEEVCRTCNR